MLVLSGIVGPILFAAVITILGFVRIDYSHVEDLISQLGATGVQYAVVQNINFVLLGLLVVFFATGLYRSVGKGKAGKIGSGLVVLAGIGAVGLGIFPEDPLPEPEEPTFSGIVHNMFSLLAFLSAIVATIIFSRSLSTDDVWRRYRPYSLITGVVAFGLMALVVLSDPEEGKISALWPWAGLIQRLLVGVWFLWIVVMAVRLLRLEGPRSGKAV